MTTLLDVDPSVDGDVLPPGWRWTTLGEVCSHPQYGWTTRASKKSEGVRLLRTTDISSGVIDWGRVPVCDEAPTDVDKYLLEDGDIVVARAGTVGVSCLISSPPSAVFASYLIRFKPNRTVADPRFISWYLKSPTYWNAISDHTTGIAIPNVNATKLASIPIPLPPLDEQRRIAERIEAVLARASAAKERLARAQATMRRFRQAVLSAACSGRLTADWRVSAGGAFDDASAGREDLPGLPRSWAVSTVGAVSKMQYGTSERAVAQLNNGVPILGMANIQDGQLVFRPLKYAPATRDIQKFLLRDGDILFNRTNSPELVGKSAVVRGLAGDMGFASYLVRVACDRTRVMPEFVCNWINSDWGKGWASRTKTDGVSQSNISASKLAAMPLPLPPIEEQLEVVKRGEALLSEATRAEGRLTAVGQLIDQLVQATLAKAIRGDLVPQNPDEQPPAVTDATIRSQLDGPTQRVSHRVPEMLVVAKSDAASRRESIRQLPMDRFSFEDLRRALPLGYDELREAVFDLLDEDPPALKQEFDEVRKLIVLVKVRP